MQPLLHARRGYGVVGGVKMRYEEVEFESVRCSVREITVVGA